MVMAIRKQPGFDLYVFQRGFFLVAEMHINGEVYEAGRVRVQLVADNEAYESWVQHILRLIEEDVQRTVGFDGEFKLVERN
jgi:hypothetical protein